MQMLTLRVMDKLTGHKAGKGTTSKKRHDDVEEKGQNRTGKTFKIKQESK